MGGVPTKHHSKSKVGRRRAHLALKPRTFRVCSHCGGPTQSHRACLQCGALTAKNRTRGRGREGAKAWGSTDTKPAEDGS